MYFMMHVIYYCSTLTHYLKQSGRENRIFSADKKAINIDYLQKSLSIKPNEDQDKHKALNRKRVLN